MCLSVAAGFLPADLAPCVAARRRTFKSPILHSSRGAVAVFWEIGFYPCRRGILPVAAESPEGDDL